VRECREVRDCGALRSSFGWCFELADWLAGWLAERNEWAEDSSSPALGNAINQSIKLACTRGRYRSRVRFGVREADRYAIDEIETHAKEGTPPQHTSSEMICFRTRPRHCTTFPFSGANILGNAVDSESGQFSTI
jgi:hypothetical protein